MENMKSSFVEKTCMEYADQLQRIIDHLLWLAWVSDDEETRNALKEEFQKLG